MSINAITSVSIYEYYYTINENSKKKQESILADEMKKYGLTPTDNESLNLAMLNRAKRSENQDNISSSQEVPKSQRPWADLMYQLGINFNDNPRDDIQDIKDELEKLTRGIDDDELNKEIDDLEKYVENLYLNFEQSYSTNIDSSTVLSAQLNSLSIINKANLY